jgi:CXXX repeat modification system protein
MNKENVGSVSETEKDQMLKLYERKLALEELLLSLNSGLLNEKQKDEVYEKVIIDLSKTNVNYQTWWNEKSKLYNWKLEENGVWSLEFETNEVFLNF